MKRILLYLFLLLTTSPALATSIVILVTPRYILIGADSRRLVLNGQAQVTEARQVEKIRSAGAYCFAMAGFTASASTAFSADAIVSRNLRQAPSYQLAIQKIKTGIKAALQKELRYQQKHLPVSFGRLAAANEPLLEIVVLGTHNGVPQLELIGFHLDGRNIKVGSYTSSCPGDCPQQQQFYFMGAYGEMEQYLDTQRGIQDPARLIESLIMAQAKATPSAVGGPVQLARYTAQGLERIQ